MGDAHVGDGIPHHGHVDHIQIQVPISVAPARVKVEAGDTVETIKGKAHHKAQIPDADSPDLAEAQMFLWVSGNNQMTVQNKDGAGISAISSAGQLAALKNENKMLEIGIKVLDAWGESLKKEAQEIRRELKSQSHHIIEAEKGKEGFEAYLNTLTGEGREKAIHHNHLDKLARIDEGMSQGLTDYIAKTKVDPSANVPFMIGTLAVGASTRFDSASGSQLSVGGQTLVNPTGGVSDNVLPKVIPTYSVEIGAMATMFGVGTAYFTMGNTVAKVTPTEPTYNLKFAKNYAHETTKVVNGSEFNTMAAAIVTAHAAKGKPLSERRKEQLVNILKIVMLSSALILLYKMESSYKGKGGGMDGSEFANLVNGTGKGSEQDRKLGAEINKLLDTLPAGERENLLQGLQAYVSTSPKASSLVNADAVFTGVGKGIASKEVQI